MRYVHFTILVLLSAQIPITAKIRKKNGSKTKFKNGTHYVKCFAVRYLCNTRHFVFFPDKMCFDKMTWKIQPHTYQKKCDHLLDEMIFVVWAKSKKNVPEFVLMSRFLFQNTYLFGQKWSLMNYFRLYLYQLHSDREVSECGLFENRSFSLFCSFLKFLERRFGRLEDARRVHQFYFQKPLFQQCLECKRNMQLAAWRKQTKSILEIEERTFEQPLSYVLVNQSVCKLSSMKN